MAKGPFEPVDGAAPGLAAASAPWQSSASQVTRLAAAKDAVPAKELRRYSMRDATEPSTERDDQPQPSRIQRRASRCTEVAHAVKALQKAGLAIAAVKVEPDGTVTVIPGTPSPVPSSLDLNPWDGAL